MNKLINLYNEISQNSVVRSDQIEKVLECLEDLERLRKRLKGIEFGKYDDGCPVCGFLKHHKSCWLAYEFNKLTIEKLTEHPPI